MLEIIIHFVLFFLIGVFLSLLFYMITKLKKIIKFRRRKKND